MNLPTPLSNPPSYPIIGKSEQIQSVWRKVAKSCSNRCYCPNHRGKQVLGKRLSQKQSTKIVSGKAKSLKLSTVAYSTKTFFRVNSFGHEKGAFTGATAQRRGCV